MSNVLKQYIAVLERVTWDIFWNLQSSVLALPFFLVISPLRDLSRCLWELYECTILTHLQELFLSYKSKLH